MGLRARAGAIIVASMMAGASPAIAQEAFPPGETVARVVTGIDPAQSYALRLPTEYDATRTWPLIILMDPRGRALLPLERVAPAAERLGFIVASSYNTASDGLAEPNVRALNALLDDVPARWSVDTERVYLVGFSGTARFAWGAADRLRGHVPGIVGFGAGLPFDVPQALLLLGMEGAPFDFFGAVGDLDFNFHEVLTLEAGLADASISHHVEHFSGGHGWPPAQVMERALSWLELRAVSRGLATRRPPWVDSVYSVWYGEAEAMEAEGRHYAAWRAYRSLVEDFQGLHETGEAEEKVEGLSRTEDVRRTLEALDRSARRQSDWERRYGSVSALIRDKEPPSMDWVLTELGVSDVMDGAAADQDRLEAASYQRILELLFVRTSFYEPRRYVAEGDLERALLMTQVAEAIRPGDPRVSLRLAEIFAQLARLDEAFEALRRFAASSAGTAGAVEDNEGLEPLRSDIRYRQILALLGGQDT
jgi:predicted esterase